MGATPPGGRTGRTRWRKHPSKKWAGRTQAERWRWHKETRAWLQTHRWCTLGYPDRCTRQATEVDHKDGCDYGTQFWDKRWWQPVCKPCHRYKTSRAGLQAQADARAHTRRTPPTPSPNVTPKPSRQWLHK